MEGRVLVIVDSRLAVEQRLPPSCTLPAEMIDSSMTSDTAADLSLNHDSHNSIEMFDLTRKHR